MSAALKITLPDNSVRSFPGPVTGLAVAESIGKKLAKDAVAIKVNGELRDLSREIAKDAKVEIITESSPEALEIIRHSTAHLMAMAVQDLYPGTQVTIGPVVEEGYYYDYARDTAFTPEDLTKIEAKMREIQVKELPIIRKIVTRQEAIKTFKGLGETFKVELIENFPEGEDIAIYHQGNWFDLCRGPHVPHTGKLRAFKLTHLSGSFWRADEKNARLQRIYGTAFATQKELDDFMFRQEEAKKRDHRKLGRELRLFTFRDEAPAMPFFYPNGQTIYSLLTDYVRGQNRARGYQEVQTPLIMDESLWRKSGHWDNYKDNMYFTEVDKRINAVKPMNCPGHVLLFSTERHSYRELPLRLSEFGRVHRYERSGVTHGLFRVRNFVQDDAHIFCTPEQIEDEVMGVIDFIFHVYKSFDFTNIRVGLSTRPAEKSIGSEEIWKRAEAALESALKRKNVKFTLYPGDGAFYGPKIDFHVEDSLGRFWQCGTCQLDFSMPARFEVSYIGEDSGNHTPVMIHRAILGSVERFFGILVEHFAGAFPFWLAPEQVRLVNITDAQEKYLGEVAAELKAHGIRVGTDTRNEKLGAKIRNSQLAKIPYTLVIGDNEMKDRKVTLRPRSGEQLQGLSWEQMLAHFKKTEKNPLEERL